MKRVPDEEGSYLQNVTDPKTGVVKKVPCEIFEVVPNERYLEVIGTSFGDFKTAFDQKPGTSILRIGPLLSIRNNKELIANIIDSLDAVKWDFKNYPDPEILLINKYIVNERRIDTPKPKPGRDIEGNKLEGSKINPQDPRGTENISK